AQYVAAICGQEAGSKKESLTTVKSHGYADDHVLMMGDAPGDMKAAQAVNALFYPINPGHEEESWQRFYDEACDKFLNGEFKGAYQDSLITEFEKLLPDKPSWK
ncbi:MAG: HAD family hydrolase, partial [Planctomycetaceae bacterium]